MPGISWVLAYTIAAEIADISRFASPRNLAGYSGLCPTPRAGSFEVDVDFAPAKLR